MAIRLGNRGPMFTTPGCTNSISFLDPLICACLVLFEPGEECGSEIEANRSVIIDDALRDVAANASKRIWAVTLCMNPLVPIVKWRRARLALYFPRSRIL